MWIFTKTSFLSVVQYDATKDRGKNGSHRKMARRHPELEGDWLLVRARVREDLEAVEAALVAAEALLKGDMRIVKDEFADYAWRGLCTREEFSVYMSLSVRDIDYDSHFKEVVRANATKPRIRYSAMLSVWTAMERLQDRPRVKPAVTSWSEDYDGQWDFSGLFPDDEFSSPRSRGERVQVSPVEPSVSAEEMRELLEATPWDEVSDAVLGASSDEALEVWFEARDAAALEEEAQA